MRPKANEFRLNSADRKIIEAGVGDLSLFTQYYFDGWTPLPYQYQFYHAPQKDKLIIAGIRSGKCLANDLPLFTPSGWRRFGDLTEGDYVFGMDGLPTRVKTVYPTRTDIDCYRVKFSDDSEIECCGEHLWLTHTYRYRKSIRRRGECYVNGKHAGFPQCQPKHFPELVTTTQIKESLYHRQQLNHAIPVVGVQLPRRDLPLDPYLLGVWLGNGSAKGNVVVTMDSEIVEAFTQAGFIPNKTKKYHYRINSPEDNSRNKFMSLLRQIDVFGNKHIPEDYLMSSFEQRLALLQGLMDTDGTIGKNGACSFDQSKDRLTADVRRLLRSLGIVFKSGSRIPKCNGKECQLSHRLWFTPNLPVFRVKRKLERQRLDRDVPNRSYKYIKSVEPIPYIPMHCIEVEAQDGMFLAGESLIPTHNSKGIAAGFCHFAFYNPKSRLANACISADQSLVVFNDVIDFVSRKRFAKFVEHVEKHPYPKIVFVNGSELWFRSTGYEAEYWRGWEFDWINVDEAAYIDKKLTIDVLKGRLIGVKNVNGLTVPRAGLFTMTSSPKGKSWLFERWKKGDSNYPEYDPQRYLSMRAKSRENVYITSEQWDQLEADYSERMIRQELQGLFLDSEDTVFPYEHIMNICAEDQSTQIATLNNQVALSLGSTTIEKKDIAYYSLPPEYGHVYINSWDIGKKPTKSGRNAMVGGVMDITEKPWKLVAFRYFPGATYGMAQEWIVEWQKKYSYNCYCDTVIDASGKGDPINERLETENNIPVDGIVYTPVIKPQMIMSLQMAMERRWMIIPFVKVIVDQLQSYELDDRKIAQDCVMMLAQATYRARERSNDYNPQYSSYEKNIVSSYRNQKELHERFVARRKAGRGRRTAW